MPAPDVSCCQSERFILLHGYHIVWRRSADPTNNSSLETIENALVVMCLDDPHPHVSSGSSDAPFNDSQCTMVSNRCLHGNGTEFNTCNRWFDATSQVRRAKARALLQPNLGSSCVFLSACTGIAGNGRRRRRGDHSGTCSRRWPSRDHDQHVHIGYALHVSIVHQATLYFTGDALSRCCLR